MINALTIDVEDYWSILSRDWLKVPDARPSAAVLKNTRWYLEILNKYDVKATFFILGEVADSFPELIKEIARDGHEIGAHGFYHRQIFKLTKDEFRKEVSDAKKLLEDICGQEVIGHRAPAFSLNAETQWALEVLAEVDFKYDTSISPIAGRRYGWPNFKKNIHVVNLPSGKNIVEVPMSNITVLGKELGVGGGYMRHFPYLYMKWAIKHIQKTRPVIVYMHPYEIDIEQRSFETQKLKHRDKKAVENFHKLQMRNRSSMKKKINNLLSDFRFTTISDIIQRSNIQK